MSHHGHSGDPSTSSDDGSHSPTMPVINEPFDPPGSVLITRELKVKHSNDRKPIINSYLRHHKVGGGQHGQVWLCTDTNSPKRQLAIKAIKRKNPREEKVKMLRYSANRPIPQQAHTPLSEKIGDAEQKIRKEIAIMKKLRHGHIVRLIEVIDDKLNDRIYMVMEYLSGGEVKWRIKAREEHPCYEPILQLDQVRRIIRDVILGLEYLHYQGIIHRDIKPGNLLWTADRQMVKISDFGVSTFSYAQRLAAAGRSKVEADDTDPLLLDDSDLSKRSGTPSFLAPEIIAEYERASDASPTSTSTSFLSSATAHASPTTSSRSKRKITKAIDVWALGVTLYCLLFGDCPFHPPPGIGGSAAEFALYTVICNEDWTPRKTMAYGRIPTGGRHPGRSAPSEARVVIRILDGLLQKDQHKRMTLDQLKHQDWFLYDIPNKKEWLRETAPRKIDMVTVTDGETDTALTKAIFSWGWGKRITNQISKFVWRPLTATPTPSSVRSEQELKAAMTQSSKQKSASARASRDPLPSAMSSKAKGKQRAGISDMLANASTPNINRRKSVEAWARDTVQPFLGRRGSDAPPLPSSYKSIGRPSSRHFSTGGGGHDDPHERSKYRFSLPAWRNRKSANQSQTPSQASSPVDTSSNMSMYHDQTGLSPNSKSLGGTPYEYLRRSDDLLRHHGRAGSLKAAPSIAESCDFTAARRASSWGDPSSSTSAAAAAAVTVIGAGRQTTEDMMSIGSGDHEPLSEDALMMGAGGIANDPMTLASGLPVGLTRVASDLAMASGPGGPGALRHPQPERLIIGAGPSAGYYAAGQEVWSPAGPSGSGAGYVHRSGTTSPSPLVQVAYDSSSEYGQWGQRQPGGDDEDEDAASYNSDVSEFYRANEEPGTSEADMHAAQQIMRHMYPPDDDVQVRRDYDEDEGEEGDDETDDDDDDDDEEEEQTYALEVKRRRPSESFAGRPPMSPLSP